MRITHITLVACSLVLGCRSSMPSTSQADMRLLPDLIIKKVVYKQPTSSPKVVLRRGGIYQPTYEFQFLIVNVGNAPFSEPFLISFTNNLIDFQSSIYSKQERFNETRSVIAPGKSLTFSMVSEVDIPIMTARVSTLPIRFLLNHDWKSQISRPETVGERELNYDNNTYELSMQLQPRR